MGAHAYWYVVKYNPDVEAALRELREREFAAGRYNPAMPFIFFPITPATPAPGPQHDTIEEAIEDAAEEGTRSILDLEHIAAEPDFGAAAPLGDEALLEYFGTTNPTRETVERNDGFFDDIDRGQGVYVVLYKDGKPDELFFAGYSYD
jgi:hypothetical protein